MDNLNNIVEELHKQKQVLQALYDEARASAVSHVQQIITDFKIRASDLEFSDEPQVRQTRTPVAGNGDSSSS